jgi:hypothetical protein
MIIDGVKITLIGEEIPEEEIREYSWPMTYTGRSGVISVWAQPMLICLFIVRTPFVFVIDLYYHWEK